MTFSEEKLPFDSNKATSPIIKQVISHFTLLSPFLKPWKNEMKSNEAYLNTSGVIKTRLQIVSGTKSYQQINTLFLLNLGFTQIKLYNV